jgi:hypothetical protein
MQTGSEWIAENLALCETTGHVNRVFRICAARGSQLRRDVRELSKRYVVDWALPQGYDRRHSPTSDWRVGIHQGTVV